MIDVNDEIKIAYNQSTMQTDRIKIGENYYFIRDVDYSDDCYDEGNVFGTAIAKILTFNIDSSVSMEKVEFEYETGIYINGIASYINLGNFIVTETEEGDTTEITKVTAMDYMLKTNIPYKTNLNYTTATILDVAIEVCSNCGLTLATTNFVNSNFRVDSNQFEENTLCRQVIQAIAQISGTIAKIKNDNQLYFINPNDVDTISQVFELKNYSEADIKRLTHPINLVSLANSQIEGENITMRDEQSISEDGENSLIINDNPFAYTQEKRTQLIIGLFNAVKGFEYKSFSFKFQMLPYIETLDKIQFLDKEGNIYNSYVFRFNYKSPDGLKSTIEAPSLTKATINYQNLPDALDMAKRTEIIVDKQNQRIESVVSNVSEQNQKIANVTQTVEELNSKISDIAEITTSQETNTGRLIFTEINQSEPIRIEIHPVGTNITKLYPMNAYTGEQGVFPSSNTYMSSRILRFTNTKQYVETEDTYYSGNKKYYSYNDGQYILLVAEIDYTIGEKISGNIYQNYLVDYELPRDLLCYEGIYDEFILDYASLSCVVNQRISRDDYNELSVITEQTIEYEFPHIELTDGDYTVELLGYNSAYLFVRLMAQNIYTTQFATKAEVNSELSQTAGSINANVNQKLTNYSTTTEMNSAINVKANEITRTVSQTYATKSELNTAKTEIKQTTDSITSTVSQVNNKANTNSSNISTLQQTAQGLASTVATKVGNNEVISKINQSSEAVTILANKLGLTANDILNLIAGNTINLTSKNIVILSTNFNVTKDGYLTCADANVTGKINATTGKIAGFTIDGKKLTTDDRTNGAFMVLDEKQITFSKRDGNNIYSLGQISVFDTNTNINFIRTDGNTSKLYVDEVTASTYNHLSKESLKKNIKKYDKSALDTVKSSEIYTFNYKTEKDGTKKHIGFIIPDNGGNYKTPIEVISGDGIDEYSMTSILWKAVQEQQQKIEKLEKRLEGK